jgi:glutathione reductase (NADPH)
MRTFWDSTEGLRRLWDRTPVLFSFWQGYILVDAFENTTAAGVYAIGDATNSGYELTPVALAAGRRLGDRLFGGEPQVPDALFSAEIVLGSGATEGLVGG